MNSPAEDQLIVRYIEGAATDAEVALLEQRLRTNAIARREFVRLSHLQALFRELSPRPRVAARPRGHRRGLLAAAAAVAAAVLVVLWWRALTPASALPTVAAMRGASTCEHASVAGSVQVGQRLGMHDRLRVGPLAELGLVWPDGTQLTIAGDSSVMVGGAGGAMMELEQGELRAVVQGHGAGPHFAIATPEGVARDMGTVFVVQREGERTTVGVTAGLVEFSGPEGSVTIPAGRRAVARSGQPPRLAELESAEAKVKPASPVATVQAPSLPDGSRAVTGTVTAVNATRKSFTLADDATGVADEYRAYYAGGHASAMAAAITAVKIGDRLTLSFTEREGRRVLTLTPIARPTEQRK